MTGEVYDLSKIITEQQEEIEELKSINYIWGAMINDRGHRDADIQILLGLVEPIIDRFALGEKFCLDKESINEIRSVIDRIL